MFHMHIFAFRTNGASKYFLQFFPSFGFSDDSPYPLYIVSSEVSKLETAAEVARKF
jgi:hypothetical protein